ncbi:MAG: ATP-binding protein [Candidatus Omnitrophota bacterium]
MKLDLRNKIVIIMLAGLFLAIGANTWISSYIFTKEYSAAIKAKSMVIGETLELQMEKLLSLGIPLNELVGFEEQCADIVYKYGVAYALVTDGSGKVLFHSSAPGQYAASIGDEKALKAIRSAEKSMQVYSEKGHKYYGAIVPVIGINNMPLGAVIIGVPVEIITKKTGELVALSLLVATISFLLAVILLFFAISKWVTSPLQKLVNMIMEIRQKGTDSAKELDIYSEDEIGELASAFNLMVKDLNKSHREVLKYAETLETKVQERTVELEEANGQLKRAYEQLKQAQFQLIQSAKMASIGQLAGGVAHEINNPLTGVLNNVQLIRMQAEMKKEFNADDFMAILQAIEESAFRCKKITEALLNFSRGSTGQFRRISPNELIKKVINLVAHEIQLENITIHTEFADGVPEVTGDVQLLQQVIFDLIANAKWAINKKSAKQGGTITIKTSADLNNKQALISVADTGIGIPKDNLDKIFEPFFTTKSVGEGTGLGLSIAYAIIREHKGNINVESDLSKGTTFRINLPTA